MAATDEFGPREANELKPLRRSVPRQRRFDQAAGRVFGKPVEDRFPYAAPRPTRIAVVDGGAGAIALRQVAPRGARPQNVKNAVQNTPIVYTLRATSALGQKQLDHRPFFVRQIKSYDSSPLE